MMFQSPLNPFNMTSFQPIQGQTFRMDRTGRQKPQLTAIYPSSSEKCSLSPIFSLIITIEGGGGSHKIFHTAQTSTNGSHTVSPAGTYINP